MTIALATCAELPTGHLEDELAERLGATWAIWDDPAVVAWLQERLGPLTYARVDLLAGPDGAPVVLELELTEPCLFPVRPRCGGAVRHRLSRRGLKFPPRPPRRP